MNAFTRLPDAAGVMAAQPIPYRTESPVTAGQTLSVFGITIAMLAAAIGVLLWTHKRGWLQRWSMSVGVGKPSRSALRVLDQARLGHASHAYVIDVDGSRFVVVESSRHVSLHSLQEGSAIPGEGHE
ncbi:hypothetical protein ACFWZ1_08700 [Frateuria sp. GZRe14]|uniref:hypothetical protein n=1 Tax=Frateuria sp. GZRe14 TaxID=3351534 RepID=UPI003EDBD198